MFVGRRWGRVKVTFGINIIYFMFVFLSSLHSYVLLSDDWSAANNKNLATLYSEVCFVIVIVAPFCVRLTYCTKELDCYMNIRVCGWCRTVAGLLGQTHPFLPLQGIGVSVRYTVKSQLLHPCAGCIIVVHSRDVSKFHL